MALFLVGIAGSAWAELPCPDGAWKLRETDVELRRLGTTTARIHVEGTLLVYGAATVDPAATGFRLRFGEGDDAPPYVPLVDLAVAGGAGWETPRPGRWVYRARVATGIRRVIVQEIDAPLYGAPRVLTVMVDAVGLTLPALSDVVQLLRSVTVGLDATSDTQACGLLYYYPRVVSLPGEEPYEPFVWEPRCTLRSKGRTLVCQSGPRVGPCKVSHPIDLARCDLVQSIAAQEVYHASHGTYFSGPCAALPGVMPSPDVSCDAAGDPTRFFVDTAHPGAPGLRCSVAKDEPIVCYWGS